MAAPSAGPGILRRAAALAAALPRHLALALGATRRLRLLEKRCEWLERELRRLAEGERRRLSGEDPALADIGQTLESFEYQWRDFATGDDLPDDPAFARDAPEIVRGFVDRPAEWFRGRRVLDLGCGVGRFTRALLELSATVAASDANPSAVAKTNALCAGRPGFLGATRRNLLEWPEPDDFGLVFCFGVVHHTGRTRLAVRHAARKVGPGGRLMLMVYGYPEREGDYDDLNLYERLREEFRGEPADAIRRALIERFGPRRAHGFFDAVSPRVNDLVSLGELKELLHEEGFRGVRRTLPSRNLHLVADRVG